jgi:type II restriction enzyme
VQVRLSLGTLAGRDYRSGSQRARYLSERWVEQEAYCPNCNADHLRRYANNRPVADFICDGCDEDYELKSSTSRFGSRVPGGAYRTMMERLASNRNPHLFLLQYDPNRQAVVNFLVVPRHYFVPSLIEERPALSPTARRAGWIGCTIRLAGIPPSGRIFLVKERVIETRQAIREKWQRTRFLGRQSNLQARGWLLATMRCLERIGKREFTIEDAYCFEAELKREYPRNRHVKEKLRQQLQVLRDMGYLEFVARGRHRLTA